MGLDTLFKKFFKNKNKIESLEIENETLKKENKFLKDEIEKINQNLIIANANISNLTVDKEYFVEQHKQLSEKIEMINLNNSKTLSQIYYKA